MVLVEAEATNGLPRQIVNLKVVGSIPICFPHKLVVQMDSMTVSKTADPGSYPGQFAKDKEQIKHLRIGRQFQAGSKGNCGESEMVIG